MLRPFARCFSLAVLNVLGPLNCLGFSICKELGTLKGLGSQSNHD